MKVLRISLARLGAGRLRAPSVLAAAALVAAAWSAAPSCAAARQAPRLRVGLAVSVEEAVVGATRGPLLVAPVDAGGVPGTFREVPGRLRLGLRRVEAPPRPPSVWHVLVGEPSSETRAGRLRDGLAGALDVPLRVGREAERHVVLAGPFAVRDAAVSVVSRLTAAGVSPVRISEEAQPAPPPPTRLVGVSSDFALFVLPSDRVVFRVAEPGALLQLDGRTWRGDLEVLASSTGGLTVVDAVALEEYLRGVVPEELGPEVFPEAAALEAQALAARTYALDQLDSRRHEGEGFDLCPTAHCQVYGGVDAEHPVSDRAVAATSGLVVAWQGGLARTFFSSTCGGKTSAVESIFPEQTPRPYLGGVECRPDSLEFHRVDGTLLEADWSLASGRAAHALLARLVAADVVSFDVARTGGFRRRASGSEAAAWTRAAARELGWPVVGEPGAPADVDSAIGFQAWFQRALGVAARAELLAGTDLDAAARFAPLRGLGGRDLEVGLVALGEGLLPEGLGAGWATERPTRGAVLEIVGRWLERRSAFDAPAERFAGPSGDGGLLLFRGDQVRTVRSGARLLLLSGQRDAAFAPQSMVELKVGDRLRAWPVEAGTARLLAVEEDRDGAAHDRMSSYSWWERVVPFDDIARRAREHGVRDLVSVDVAVRGSSGRITAIRLLDSSGAARTVRGFAARAVLGLPDLRAVLTVQRDRGGQPVAIVAVGRGWGHGVGLCQTGAYGMAVHGSTAERIVGHYYPGTEIVPLVSLR